MTRVGKILAGSLLVFTAAVFARLAGADEPAAKPQETRPQVEVVFCLDTTGSMGGLIEAAKQKIWAISNQIASGTPTPTLKIGLVAYRDRGDAYVTQIHELTDDLDGIHGQLMKLQAQGGGDFPESVNQALHEAVTKLKWSDNKKTLKIIFLVGDAPPKMSYPDDVKYQDTCKMAVAKDIIINTVQCGTHAETRKYWEEICRLGEGSYVQIDARGGPVATIATPFDAELAKINGELNRSTLVFGRREAQLAGEAKVKANAALPAGPAADRAAFYGRSGAGASYDLLQNVKDGKVKLEELKDEELPAELQKLDLQGRKDYLKKLDETRKNLNLQAVELDRQRNEFIQKQAKDDAKGTARDSFDSNVLDILRRQAGRANIQYATPPEAAPKAEKK